MYRIVGKENLEAVNVVADRSLEVIRDLSQITDNTRVGIDSDKLLSLATGYLFLYQVVLDHGLLPSQKSTKHQIFKVH